MRDFLPISLIFLLLLTTLAFAADLDLIHLLVPAIFMIVIIILAIMWMASDTLNMPQLRAWVKLEIRELIIAAILLGVIYSAFFIQRAVTKTLTGTDGYMQAAKDGISDTLKIHKDAFNNLIILSSRLTSLSSYGYNFVVSCWYCSISWSRSPYSGGGSLIGAVTLAAQGEATAIFVYKTMAVFLDFFDVTVFSVILPLGLVLRAIPFFRQLGNTIIALSLAAVVLYPFSLILIKAAHNLPGFTMPHPALSSSDIDKLTIRIPDGLKKFCSNTFSRIFIGINDLGWQFIPCPIVATACGPGYAACFETCRELMANVIYPLATAIMQLSTSLSLLVADQAYIHAISSPEIIFDITNNFLQDVNSIIVLSYVDVIVVALITIAGARSISSALGGEMYLVGLERLV